MIDVNGIIYYYCVYYHLFYFHIACLPSVRLLGGFCWCVEVPRRKGEKGEEEGGDRRIIMWCQSCREEYEERDAGTCKECYEEASETEEELKREIDDLKSKVAFLRLASPHDLVSTTDLVLHASSSTSPSSPSNPNSSLCTTPAVPAHRAVLVSALPSFLHLRLSFFCMI